MRRKYSKILEGNFSRKMIKYKGFQSTVYHIQFDSRVKPSFFNDGVINAYIKNRNYTWYEVYPKNDTYLLTIMFDDKLNIIQWYFDISKNINTIDVPYQDDLFLDMVITPDGKKHILDEDELLEALNNGAISKKEYESAYEVLRRIEKQFGDNFKYLLDFTEYVCSAFSHDSAL
ncbi:MAG: DUF402 domain-containing protein [bacterium]|nr:DUF402 domain-containing protein [bacterium]